MHPSHSHSRAVMLRVESGLWRVESRTPNPKPKTETETETEIVRLRASRVNFEIIR